MEEENQTSSRVKKVFELHASEPESHPSCPISRPLFRLPSIPKEFKDLAIQSRQKSKKVLTNTTIGRGPQMPSLPTPEVAPAPKITPTRVTGWKLREQLVAFRRLKALRRLEASSTHRIKPLEKQPEINEQAEYWKEVVKSKQERHFSMNRIIKYLSE